MNATEEAKHIEIAREVMEKAKDPIVGMVLAQHYLRGAKLAEASKDQPNPEPALAVA
jgi:hypothetical protein